MADDCQPNSAFGRLSHQTCLATLIGVNSEDNELIKVLKALMAMQVCMHSLAFFLRDMCPYHVGLVLSLVAAAHIDVHLCIVNTCTPPSTTCMFLVPQQPLSRIVCNRLCCLRKAVVVESRFLVAEQLPRES